MSVRDEILASELWKSGDLFTVKAMSEATGCEYRQVSAALHGLKDQGKAFSEVGKHCTYWCKPYSHWIHKARLNDAAGLKRARA